MATKEEQALQTLTTYFDHKTGNVPAAMAVLEQAVKEHAEMAHALESIGRNTSGREPLAAAYARGVLEELDNAG
jgi:hypothetical protein